MAKAKVFNMAAEEVGSITLKENVFEVEYNEPLIHEAVVIYEANQRQGSKSTLTRSEVRGHAKKPWRQKHTGRARHGSTKSPEYKGGGVVFAPKPRDFSKKLNKQQKGFAFVSALSQKLAQKEITILDELKLSEVKTKKVQEMLNAFKFSGKTVLVTAEKDENILRASANIPSVSLTTAYQLGVHDVVINKNVVITKEAVKLIEEAYKE